MISGAGTFTKAGLGTLTLSNSNTYSGQTTVSGGTLRLAANNVIGNSSTVSVASGTTFNLDGYSDVVANLDGSGSILLGSDILSPGSLTFGGNNQAVGFGGSITGVGSATKTGSGLWTVSSPGSIAPAVSLTIDQGTLRLGVANGVGTSTSLVVASGALFDKNNYAQTLGSLSGAGGVALGTTNLTVGSSNTNTTFSGVISGTAGLVKNGTGTLTLSGANTYTGTTTINNGTVTLGAGNVLADSSNITINSNGNLALSGSFSDTIGNLSGSGNMILNSGTLIVGNGNGSSTFSGPLLGTSFSSFRKTGTGVLTLSGNSSSHSGNIQVLAGTLSAAHHHALGTSQGVTTVSSGATLQIQHLPGQRMIEPINLAGAGQNGDGALRLVADPDPEDSSYADSRIDVNLTSNSTIHVVSTGTDSAFEIWNRYGTINIGGHQLTIAGDGLLHLSENRDTSEYPNSSPVRGLIGSGTIIVQGALKTEANPDFTGNFVIPSGGILSVGGLVKVASTDFDPSDYGPGLGSGPGTTIVEAGGTLELLRFFRSHGETSEALSLAGTLLMTNTTSWDGPVDIQLSGTEAAIHLSGSSFGGATVAGSGKILGTNTSLHLRNRTWNADYALIVERAIQLGSGGLRVSAGSSGGHETQLHTAATYAGATTVESGTLKLMSSHVLPDLSRVIVNTGATLDVITATNNTAEAVGSLEGGGDVLTAAGTFTTGGNGQSTLFSGSISGGSAFVKQGVGTLTFAGANTYSGGTTISGGSLQVGNGGTSGSVSGNIVNDSALIFNRSNNMTFAGSHSGTGSLTKLGAGTLILSGAHTHTGGTTISSGTLQVGAGLSGGSLTGNVTNNSVFAFDRSTALTFSGTHSGMGSLLKNGSGMLTFTGDHTHTGGTTVSEGILRIGNGGTTGTISGAIGNNAQVVFNRSNNHTHSGLMTGTGSLVKEGNATLILTGAFGHSGGTTISGGTLQLGNGGTTGSLTGSTVNSGTFAVNRSNDYTFSGAISGAGGFVQSGAGRTVLSGANSYDGPTLVSAGTLATTSQASLGSTNGATTVLSGSTLELGPLPSINDRYQEPLHLTGTGSAGQGALFIPNLTVFYDAPITLGGDTLMSSSVTVDDAFRFFNALDLGSHTLSLSGRGFRFTLSSTLSGSGNLMVFDPLGPSTQTSLELDAANPSFTGQLEITDNGLVEVGHNQALGGTDQGATVNNGELWIKEGLTIANEPLALGNQSQLLLKNGSTWTGSADISISGQDPFFRMADQSVVSGSGRIVGDNVTPVFFADPGTSTLARSLDLGTGGLRLRGNGALQLGAPASYSGTTILENSPGAGDGAPTTLTLLASDLLPDASDVVILSNKLLNLNHFNETIGSLSGGGNVQLGSGTLTVGANGNSTTFSGVISGSGGLAKSGGGAFTIDNIQNYTGTTRIFDGTLRHMGNGYLPPATDVLISSSGTWDVNSVTQNVAALAGEGVVNLGSFMVTLAVGSGNTSTTYAGEITGAGQVSKYGTGTFTLSGPNTFAGQLSVMQGIVLAASNTALGQNPYNAFTAIGAGLHVNGGLSIGKNLVLQGFGPDNQGALAKRSGNGETVLSGSISLINHAGIGNSDSLAPLKLTGTIELGESNLTFGGESHQIEGDVSGTGAIGVFLNDPLRLLRLSGNNTNSGGLFVLQGIVQAASDTALGTGPANIGADAWLDLAPGVTTGAQTLNLAGILGGEGNTRWTGNEAINLMGSNAMFRSIGGALTIDGGGNISGTETDVELRTEPGASLVITRSLDVGTGDIKITGGGSLTLAGPVTTNTGTILNAGTLTVPSGGSVGGPSLTVRNGATLVITGNSIHDDTSLDLETSAVVNVTGFESVDSLFINGIEMPAGTYGAPGSEAMFIDGQRFAGSGVVMVATGVAQTGYLAWAVANAPLGGPDKDFDDDGVPNIIEYLLGGTKDTKDLGKLPTAAATGGRFLFSFVCDQDARTPDLALVIQVSTNLKDWNLTFDVETAPEVETEDLGNGKERITLDIPMQPDLRKFARLAITVVPP